MRYEHLEYDLPINAFQPRGGRSPFARGMTLEGKGGGGGVLGGVTNALGSVAKGITGAVKGVVQPVYNATLKNIPGVDKALVSLDKSVGKAIPGGWGTVAAIASSFIPGSQLALLGMTSQGLATGLGALSGSGVMHKGNKFNLQGAIMGGAMAYGASQLGEAFQNAGSDATTKSIEEAAKANTTNAVAQTVPTDVNAGLAGTNPPAPVSDVAPNLMKAAQSNIDPSILEGMSSSEVANANVLNSARPTGLGALKEAGAGTVSNMGNAGQGALNLVGLGADGSAAAAREAFTGAASPITNAGMAAGIMGTAGLASLEEQQKYLDSQLASGNIAQGQYDTEKAKIAEQIATANAAVSANPLKSSTDISNVSEGPSLYAKQTNSDTLYDKEPTGGSTLLYAAGGAVNPTSTNPTDDQTNIANQSPIQQIGGQDSLSGLRSILGLGGNQPTQQSLANTELYQPNGGFPSQLDSGTGSSQPTSAFGGLGGQLGGMGSNQGAFPLQGNYGIVKMAAGGMAPRFLSGGGDGMSDSIHANINGSQEARLADGEFVVPADVVSHLGNGSSKAGAKQLYSMMDKVRQARTGTKKQGKQINPRKYLAA